MKHPLPPNRSNCSGRGPARLSRAVVLAAVAGLASGVWGPCRAAAQPAPAETKPVETKPAAPADGSAKPAAAQPAGDATKPTTTPAKGDGKPGATPAPADPKLLPPGPGEPPAGNPQLEPYESRLVREVQLTGLKSVDETLVRNQVRTTAGRPFSVRTIEEDLRRVNRLGRFGEITIKIQPYDDQTIAVIINLVETPIIKTVQSAGNMQISDQEIGAEVDVLAGTPVDRFQLDRAVRRIKDLYRKKGYYQADVVIDEKELAESSIVLFRIREGERLKITEIRFSGNKAFDDDQLGPNVKTRTWGLFSAGALDDVLLDQDIASVITFYKDHGYLDVRVDRQIRPSPDGREAIITFMVDEGRVYTLRSVRVAADDGNGSPDDKPLAIFNQAQIAGLMTIKAGDTYSQDKIRKSVDAVSEAYGKLGYIDARVSRAELRDVTKPEVDLLLLVTEGRRFMTGAVLITGNDQTQQKVIRREIKVYPDRPLDAVELRDSERRLRNANLFDRAKLKLSLQPEDPAQPGARDVLVEIGETNTGSLSFGAAVSSDAGLLASVTLNQRNFDIADTPDSFSEYISGRAFRGGGQGFTLALQPGTQLQNYLISLSEPSLLDSDYGGLIGGGYRTRNYDQYNESRSGGNGSLGRRFGEVWYGSLTFRADAINISDVNDYSIDDIKAVAGYSTITGVGINMRRSTLDSPYHATKGSKLDLNLEQVGALGGSYNYTRLFGTYSTYLTIAEDFIGRKTILSFRSSCGYMPQGIDAVPIFERLFLGGRDLRGFKYRGVSPPGIVTPPPPGLPYKTDSGTGGTWAFFFGTEVEQPLFQEFISIVGFCDSGTVLYNPSLEEYRVSVGLGLRLYLPQLGPAPLAFDFGFPLAKQPFDQTQMFSFSLDIPF